MRHQGFTVIELLVTVLFLAAASIVLFFQIDSIGIQQLNSQKKVAINAMYFSLEESFYPQNGYYPEKIEDKTLPTMDPELLTDPLGVKLGEPNSSYRYEPRDCNENKCKSYVLRASLTNEADFIKESRNK